MHALCVYSCVSMHICMYAWLVCLMYGGVLPCNAMRGCMHACMYACNACMYVCNVCNHIHVCMYMCVCRFCLYAIHACVFVCMHACVFMRAMIVRAMHVMHACDVCNVGMRVCM